MKYDQMADTYNMNVQYEKRVQYSKLKPRMKRPMSGGEDSTY
jgi:hypothetical protein